ncbi:hypothetical protein [Devosia submarina]|uniref:hypothetical protein n=1 Tax=Devosia submarina TaxID=1173082 RepID=UPI000D3A0D47|nr:hypothetical protein [Devosia submarina]
MPNRNSATRQHIFVKLILSTSEAMVYYSDLNEYDPDDPLSQRIHKHLVKEFEEAYFNLIVDLEELGFEVYREFYVDELIGEEYHLTVGHDDRDDVKVVVETFHEEAQAIIMKLPEINWG